MACKGEEIAGGYAGMSKMCDAPDSPYRFVSSSCLSEWEVTALCTLKKIQVSVAKRIRCFFPCPVLFSLYMERIFHYMSMCNSSPLWLLDFWICMVQGLRFP